MTRRSWRGRRGGGTGFELREGAGAEGDPRVDARPEVGAGEGATSPPAGSWAAACAAALPPRPGQGPPLGQAVGGLGDGGAEEEEGEGDAVPAAASDRYSSDAARDADCADLDASHGDAVAAAATAAAAAAAAGSERAGHSADYGSEASSTSGSGSDVSDLDSADEDYVLNSGLGSPGSLALEAARTFAGLQIEDSLTVYKSTPTTKTEEAPVPAGRCPAGDDTFTDMAESLWHRRQGYRQRKKERRREDARQKGDRGRGSAPAMGERGRLKPGEKARVKKEGREARRAERAALRGFDLKAANASLASLAARTDGPQARTDADCPHVAFASLGKLERKLVRKIANLYGLRTECLGGGKRASLIVTASTGQAGLPQGQAEEELEGMIADWNFRSAGEVPPTRRAQVAGPRVVNCLRRREDAAARPPEFVSGGTLVPCGGEDSRGDGMQQGGGEGADRVEEHEHPGHGTATSRLGEDSGGAATPSPPQVMGMRQYAAFEAHTTGFGSRMLAKMGFKGEGSGLGRSGQGIAAPVLAQHRPKKQGLGSLDGQASSKSNSEKIR